MRRSNPEVRKQFRTAVRRDDQPWYVEKVKANPVKTLVGAIVGFGGLLLLMFFGHLGELPELSLSSSTSLLWAIAIIGFVMVVFFLLPTVIPLCSIPSRLTTPREKVAQLAWCAVPGLLIVLLALAIICLGASLSVWSTWGLLGGLSWLAADAHHYLDTCVARSEGGASPSRVDYLGETLLGVFFWMVGLSLAILFVWTLYGSNSESGGFLVAAIAVSLALSIVSCFVVAAVDWKKDVYIVGALAACVVVLPAFASRNPTAIGVAAVKAFGLGERPAKLVVTANGCDVINRAAGKVVCRVDAGQPHAVVCPAILRSRIGSPYFVELSPLGADGRWPEKADHPLIPVDSKDVLSWPRLNVKAQGASLAASGAGPASAANTGSEASPPPNSAQGRAVATYLEGRLDHGAEKDWISSQCGPAPAVADAASGPVTR